MAQTVITRLPKDGCWALYEVISETYVRNESSSRPEDEKKITIKGEIVVRSVGTEYRNMKSLRWVEIETKTFLPTTNDQTHTVIQTVKALVPENQFGQGSLFPNKIQKILFYNSNFGKKRIVELKPSSAIAKLTASSLIKPDKFDLHSMPPKNVDTGIGKFRTDTFNYSGELNVRSSLESGTANEKNEDAIAKEQSKVIADEIKATFPEKLYMSYVVHCSDQTPFGLAKTTGKIMEISGDQKIPLYDLEITLKKVGTGAKSTISDKK